MGTTRLRGVLSMVAAVGVAACGPTTELTTWKDPDFQGPGFRSVMVMVMSDNLTGRTAIEEAIARRLDDRGISAVQSLSVFSPDAVPAYDTLEARLAAAGVDAILIVEPIGREDITRYVEGLTYYDTYSTYMDARSRRVSNSIEPARVEVIGTIYRGRTSLYANRTDELAWRAESETPFYGDIQTSARDFATTVVTAMEKGGMLHPPPAPRSR